MEASLKPCVSMGGQNDGQRAGHAAGGIHAAHPPRCGVVCCGNCREPGWSAGMSGVLSSMSICVCVYVYVCVKWRGLFRISCM